MLTDCVDKETSIKRSSSAAKNEKMKIADIKHIFRIKTSTNK